MKSIDIKDIPNLTSPNPVSLVCTELPDGGTNLAAISWWTFVSFEPPLIGIAILVLQRDLGTSLLFFGLFVALLYVATDRVSWLVIGALMLVTLPNGS